MNKLMVALTSVMVLAGCGAADAEEAELARVDGSSEWTKDAPLAPPRTFEGYTCTDDCSGHEAGYEWAEEKGITDPDDCGGNSDSFIEGCEAYAQDSAESDDYDYDDY